MKQIFFKNWAKFRKLLVKYTAAVAAAWMKLADTVYRLTVKHWKHGPAAAMPEILLAVTEAIRPIQQKMHELSTRTLAMSLYAARVLMSAMLGHDLPRLSREAKANYFFTRGTHMSIVRASSISRIISATNAAVRHVVGYLADAVSAQYAARLAKEAVRAQVWDVERSARTEFSFAWNMVQRDVVSAANIDGGAFKLRWTEHVSDVTGLPLDNRVGDDSLDLHGQIADVGGLFTMPLDARYFSGKSWHHPPNRPNDRAVIMPWLPGLGIPAYTTVNGSRVDL